MRSPVDPSALAFPVTTAQGPPDVVPLPSTPQGGSRRFILEEVLARNMASGTYAAQTAKWRMSLPSPRLQSKITVGYRPFNGEWLDLPQSGVGAWKMDVREFARTSRGGYVAGGLVVQGLVLPNSWEATTLSREWRGSIVVPTEHVGSEGTDPGTGLSMPGELVAVAEWEPAPGESSISDAELAQLFTACGLFAEEVALVSSTGS